MNRKDCRAQTIETYCEYNKYTPANFDPEFNLVGHKNIVYHFAIILQQFSIYLPKLSNGNQVDIAI